MDLRQLKYFLGVCEHGSIAKAAREMHIAQPALSRQMAQLEETLGIALFHRLPRGVSLTRSGEELHARASALLAQAQEISHQVQHAARGLTGTLRIGVMPGYSWLPQLGKALRFMHDEASGVQVQVETLHATTLLERLRAHSIDVVLTGWRSPYDPAFQGVPAFEDHMVAAIPTNRAARLPRRALTLSDLQDLPFLMFPREKSPLHYDTLMNAFSKLDVKPLRTGISVADIPTAIGMVASGFGWSFAPASYARQWAGAVVFRRIKEIEMQLSVELVWRSADQDPVLAQFLQAWKRSKPS